ncbi:MAG: tetratricopeptide repeat protein [Candidatus Eremiobacteraeota bacterium]|nr:tetratricopeptide repeat protein [Candidatus Eremiobacteraeota bacterium]
MTVLLAAAGFGKSTALRAFVKAHPLDHVRFDVKPGSRSLISFVRGFANAIATTSPNLGLSLAGAFDAAKQSSEPSQVLADWLLVHLSTAPTTIVVDDLHHIDLDPEVCSLVKTLVERTSGNKRWIISTRSSMELPIASWRERGAMDALVDEADLVFTSEEASKLARLSNSSISEAEVVALLDLTDGWPAAFVLGLSALPPHLIMQRSARTHEATYRFLAENLLSNSKPHIKQFLLQTSVFPSLDARLLENSEWEDQEVILGELGKSGGVISWTSEGTPHYPELLRDFLKNELKHCGDQTYKEAVKRAASALERGRDIVEALRFYTEAAASKDVARLLEENGFNLIESGSIDIVQASMPIAENEEEHSAIVSALRGFFEFQRSRFDTSEAWFGLAMKRAKNALTKVEVVYRYCLTLMHRRQTSECIALLEPYVDSPGLPPERQASIYSTLAMAYVLSQRFPEAQELMRRALELLEATDSKNVHAEIYQSASWTALFTGDIADARRMAPMAVTIAVDAGLYDVAARALTVLYNIAGDIDDDPMKSLDILSQIADCALKSGNTVNRLYALTGAFLIEAERGNTRAAMELSTAISYYDLNYSDVYTSESLLPGQALMMAGNGQFSEAFNLLTPSAGRQISTDREAMRWSEIALYAAAASLKSEAAAAVSAAENSLCVEPILGMRRVRIALNLALVLMLLDRTTEAEQLLRETGKEVITQSIGLRCLYGAVKAIFENFQGARNHTEVLSKLNALRTNNLGGLALVYESLPISPKGG